MMVLTHCDGIAMEKFKFFADLIRTSTTSRDIADYCSIGIFPHGTLNFDQLEQFKEERFKKTRQDLIEQKYELITPMRKVLLKKIIDQQSKAKPVKELEEVMKIIKTERDRLLEREVQNRRRKCLVM